MDGMEGRGRPTVEEETGRWKDALGLERWRWMAQDFGQVAALLGFGVGSLKAPAASSVEGWVNHVRKEGANGPACPPHFPSFAPRHAGPAAHQTALVSLFAAHVPFHLQCL